MKKILSVLIVISLLFSSIPYSSYAAENATIIVAAEVINKTGVVNISGNISTGAGKEVTVVVINPSKSIDYINQATSGENGSFNFSYILDEKVKGTYRVRVGGSNVSQPVQIDLSYDPYTGSGDGGSGNNGGPGNGEGNGVTVVNAAQSNDGITAKAAIGSDLLEGLFKVARENADGTKKVIIEIPAVQNAERYSVSFDIESLSAQSGALQVELRTPNATVLLPKNMFTGNKEIKSGNIEIVIAKADKSTLSEELNKKIGDKPVIDINVYSNGKLISWHKPETPVTISIKYQPTADELKNPEHIVIWYIDDKGNLQSVPNGKYNSETGMVTFRTNHFSTYAIAYVQKTFEDLGGYPWAKDRIGVMASKGIISGTSQTTYAPGKDISRADFICLLVKALELEANFDENFDDVKPVEYYYNPVGIAKKLGIISGQGNNKFTPKSAISRQDMMVMVSKALKIAKNEKISGSKLDLEAYKDTSKISAYAIDSVATLVKMGIIAGSSNNINPKNNLSRAESAVIIYKLYNKYN